MDTVQRIIATGCQKSVRIQVIVLKLVLDLCVEGFYGRVPNGISVCCGVGIRNRIYGSKISLPVRVGCDEITEKLNVGIDITQVVYSEAENNS